MIGPLSDNEFSSIFPEAKPSKTGYKISLFKEKLLKIQEAYQRSSKNIDWLDVVRAMKDVCTKRINKAEYDNFLKKLGIEFKVIYNRVNCIGGYFNLENGKIVFEVADNILCNIYKYNDSQLKDLAQNFWVNFVHEDTHLQQASKSKIKLNLQPTTKSFWNVDLKEDLSYFDQHEEADAYGREIGARLEATFSNIEPLKIFDLISSNSSSIDEYTNMIINIYKDPRMSLKSKKDFLRSLYDYLMRNEILDYDDDKFISLEEEHSRLY